MGLTLTVLLLVIGMLALRGGYYSRGFLNSTIIFIACMAFLTAGLTALQTPVAGWIDSLVSLVTRAAGDQHQAQLRAFVGIVVLALVLMWIFAMLPNSISGYPMTDGLAVAGFLIIPLASSLPGALGDELQLRFTILASGVLDLVIKAVA